MQVLLARGVGGARRRVWGPRSRFDIAVDVVEQVAVGGGQPHRVVPGSAVACADLPQQGADPAALGRLGQCQGVLQDRKSTRLNSSHVAISYAVFCLKKKNIKSDTTR